MKKIFHASLLLLGLTLFSEAATRGDVKVIEASENIRYLSQKIVKNYLFFYKNQEQTETKKRLKKELNQLSNDLRIIATTTKDTDTKDILEFLAYSKDQIEQIFNEKADKEKAALMLDYSETLLEGADSIALAHKYNFSREEQMLMVTKKMEYLLERITKYYMAIHVGFNSTTTKEQMKKAMTEMEESLLEISLYDYPEDMKKIQMSMDDSWSANRIFFERSENLFIPKLMFTSVAYIEDFVAQLALYHSKNQ
jgi:arsenate reductase-like glutaredoxin family protein